MYSTHRKRSENGSILEPNPADGLARSTARPMIILSIDNCYIKHALIFSGTIILI